ncbi:biotin carboxyl carrier protein of methylcrotonyl-CoA carboxylase [Bacillus sp. JCM 19046]|uniref:Acetyl-CoA carboxylase biotin carboxyl carrier protein n=1 Tax=Shouchella xiaoxiensis TaxID=766895 RepID=A0ABS2SRZ3_9BACI|nr:acetyl-CoA carboxylase biotin carboxyl carrier protein subunit [Shouchella xiaoxiensis]MBM7837946.1 acetyl-CoA carboxylase biotin carboxyl carrier protein [Shouchella xiaoxiensis]GAF12248.1 biotin carboxyl carrier protein of methylcrotonyl-CoA carboxylase [Bacillus sp. JCM 19045]GAF18631.1 biotin carboxyl carrier protein of methylcrotonyl-CoA carboxylase [Bacillus sp. JCM 19046]
MSQITATMAGNVWKVTVKEGDQITEGQEVVILESMKMEIPIEAEVSGKVKTIHKPEGDFVNEGDVLIELED